MVFKNSKQVSVILAFSSWLWYLLALNLPLNWIINHWTPSDTLNTHWFRWHTKTKCDGNECLLQNFFDPRFEPLAPHQSIWNYLTCLKGHLILQWYWLDNLHAFSFKMLNFLPQNISSSVNVFPWTIFILYYDQRNRLFTFKHDLLDNNSINLMDIKLTLLLNKCQSAF